MSPAERAAELRRLLDYHDAQFVHINETVARAIEQGQPAISVGNKERELVGDFKAVVRELEPKGKPVEVRTHDFKDKELGHAIPYGVLDLTRDMGWVNVGIDRDTAQFAAAGIKGWWEHLGCERYPDARSLMITADSGGSNSHRTRLWKVELQKLVDAIGPRDHRLPRPARNQQVDAAPSGRSSKFDFSRCRRSPREPLRPVQQQAHRAANASSPCSCVTNSSRIPLCRRGDYRTGLHGTTQRLPRGDRRVLRRFRRRDLAVPDARDVALVPRRGTGRLALV